jgi:putative salt-induced outer membrane protein YdiY
MEQTQFLTSLVFTLSTQKKFSPSFYGKFYAEWLKTIGNDNRNIVVSEISGNSRMSEMLTLKVAYLMRYDDTLQDRGFEHSNDRILTVAVIATY